MIAFDHAALLLLAPLAFAPFFGSALRGSVVPALGCAPEDGLSLFVEVFLKLCGIVAVGASLLGAAGPFLSGEEV